MTEPPHGGAAPTTMPFPVGTVPWEDWSHGERFAGRVRSLGKFAGATHVGVNVEELPPDSRPATRCSTKATRLAVTSPSAIAPLACLPLAAHGRPPGRPRTARCGIVRRGDRARNARPRTNHGDPR